MLKSTLIKRAMIVLTGLTLVAGLTACGGHRNHGDRMEMAFDYVARKLDFNEQQEEILGRFKTEMKAIQEQGLEQRKASSQQLVALIEAEQWDEEQVQLMVDQHQQKIATYSPPIKALLTELHATLTPEQKETMVDFINKHGERHWGNH